MQPATFGEGHRDHRAGAVQAPARRPVSVPVDQVDEGSLIAERRIDLGPPAGFEYEAGLRAVDADLLDIRIGKMFGKWAEGGHPREDSPPEQVELFWTHRHQGALLFLSNYTPDELVDPQLV